MVAEFRSSRRDLAEAYQRIAGENRDHWPYERMRLGELLLGLVEGVISMRRARDEVTSVKRHAIASSVLRICGVSNEAITAAATTADLVRRQLI